MSGSTDALVVPRRFRGPATSGNGGWTSGALAAALLDADDARGVRVRLSAPPPLETAMTLERSEDSVTASAQGRLVATATLLDDASGPDPVPHVSVDAAEEAAERYAGLTGHPFPECFVCGPARSDGLALRPGPVHDGGAERVAAVWRPDETLTGDDDRVTAPVVWAALDCPGGWSVDIVGRPMVLGTMTGRVLERPPAGEPLVVAGRALDVSERKAVTATTLYRPDGRVLALATHVWVAVDPATFGAQ